jgi:hypothetical protein
MVRGFFAYTLVCLRRERALPGLALGSLVLAVGALFLGATLLTEKTLAARAFFEAMNTPFVTLGVTCVALLSVTRQQQSGEKDFFFAQGLSYLPYTIILFLTHTLMLAALGFAGALYEVLFFQTTWTRASGYGVSLLGQGTLLLWLSLSMTCKSLRLSHNLVFMCLLYLLGRLRGMFFLKLGPAWKGTPDTAPYLDPLLQGLLWMIPPFDLFSNEHTWSVPSLWAHALGLSLMASLVMLKLNKTKACIAFVGMTIFLLAPTATPKTPPDGLIPGPAPTRAFQILASHAAPSFYGYAGLFHLHHTGDLSGQRLPLKEYHYPHVVDWLQVCGDLMPQSKLPPLLGAFYYGASPLKEQRRLMAHYLDVYSKKETPDKNLWQQYAQILAR